MRQYTQIHTRTKSFIQFYTNIDNTRNIKKLIKLLKLKTNNFYMSILAELYSNNEMKIYTFHLAKGKLTERAGVSWMLAAKCGEGFFIRVFKADFIILFYFKRLWWLEWFLRFFSIIDVWPCSREVCLPRWSQIRFFWI